MQTHPPTHTHAHMLLHPYTHVHAHAHMLLHPRTPCGTVSRARPACRAQHRALRAAGARLQGTDREADDSFILPAQRSLQNGRMRVYRGKNRQYLWENSSVGSHALKNSKERVTKEQFSCHADLFPQTQTGFFKRPRNATRLPESRRA